MLLRTTEEWRVHADPTAPGDLWLFGYASLIWRPDFEFAERRVAQVYGWHRALKMWSRVNRGTPELPGLVFGLLSGGRCRGVVFRVPAAQAHDTLLRVWEREMFNAVYDPRWLHCQTPDGPVRALAFTLSRQSPNFTGTLSDMQYRQIFARASGRYGSSRDYARQTFDALLQHGIHDTALARLMRLSETADDTVSQR